MRTEVASHHSFTEEQRAAIDVEFDVEQMSHTLRWVAALHADPDAMRRLAASSHPVIRRSVARARRLPADAVERLSRDEDRVVQLFLAESCDDAPADMLLEVATWWTGSFSHWDRPRTHPNFPLTGLLRFADDPNWRLRRLALDDPESTPEHVEAFIHDPDRLVRVRAAGDARLSAAAAAWLLNDPEPLVRAAAAKNEALLPDVVVSLLLAVRTDSPVAGNPTIPVPVMYRMLDLFDQMNQGAR